MISSAISRKRLVDHSEVSGSKLVTIRGENRKNCFCGKTSVVKFHLYWRKTDCSKKNPGVFCSKMPKFDDAFLQPFQRGCSKNLRIFREKSHARWKKGKYWIKLTPVEALLHIHLAVYFSSQSNGISFWFLQLGFCYYYFSRFQNITIISILEA